MRWGIDTRSGSLRSQIRLNGAVQAHSEYALSAEVGGARSREREAFDRTVCTADRSTGSKM